MLEIEYWVGIDFRPLEIRSDVFKYVLCAGNRQSNRCKIPTRPSHHNILSVFLLLLFTSKAHISLPLQNIDFGHLKTNFGSQFTRVSVLTKKWKAPTVVKEMELITVCDSQNQI